MALAEYVVDNCVPLFRGYGENIGLGQYCNHIHVNLRPSFGSWDECGDGNKWREWLL